MKATLDLDYAHTLNFSKAVNPIPKSSKLAMVYVPVHDITPRL